ncbi:MAG: DegV family protein [Clostridia bacterium]|nr:DegV family protein [Clostridia bacterium]
MNVKIISDSTCDLSLELISKYDIDILPLHVLLGEAEYSDGVDITPDEIYAWSNENNASPKTSAPALDAAYELFERHLKDGREIVCFSISNQMSGTGNVMRLAAQALNAEDRIHIIDSQNLSTGIGLLIIKAALASEAGMSGNEIVTLINGLIPKVRSSFVVDTLTFLYRGGRCSSVAALAGSALKLHPKIGVSDGKMAPGKKYMGSIGRAVMNYAHDLENDLKNAECDRVFITHSGCDEEMINEVRTYLESLAHFDEILVTRAGAVISSHCGPNTLGILFISK